MESDLISRSYLQGNVIIVDSINDTILQQTVSSLSTIFQDYVNTSTLSIHPNPLLQDYILHTSGIPDGIIIVTYCERVQTVCECEFKLCLSDS